MISQLTESREIFKKTVSYSHKQTQTWIGLAWRRKWFRCLFCKFRAGL